MCPRTANSPISSNWEDAEKIAKEHDLQRIEAGERRAACHGRDADEKRHRDGGENERGDRIVAPAPASPLDFKAAASVRRAGEMRIPCFFRPRPALAVWQPPC
jgi:hypothetical protein